jgi:hypothetical protein
MTSSDKNNALLAVLERCRELVSASVDSDWSNMDVAEIFETLDTAIRRLETHQSINKNNLLFLFLPTGPLQETSMCSGWGEEYLVLAAQFDALIGVFP